VAPLTGAEAQVQRHVDALVQKGMSLREATTQVLNGDRGLYDSYRLQASGGQPTAPVDPPVTPVVKAPITPTPAPLIPESTQAAILATAKTLSPTDVRKGLMAVEAALAELRDLAPQLRA
jgi:hypothetical protein